MLSVPELLEIPPPLAVLEVLLLITHSLTVSVPVPPCCMTPPLVTALANVKPDIVTVPGVADTEKRPLELLLELLPVIDS